MRYHQTLKPNITRWVKNQSCAPALQYKMRVGVEIQMERVEELENAGKRYDVGFLVYYDSCWVIRGFEVSMEEVEGIGFLVIVGCP